MSKKANTIFSSKRETTALKPLNVNWISDNENSSVPSEWSPSNAYHSELIITDSSLVNHTLDSNGTFGYSQSTTMQNVGRRSLLVLFASMGCVFLATLFCLTLWCIFGKRIKRQRAKAMTLASRLNMSGDDNYSTYLTMAKTSADVGKSTMMKKASVLGKQSNGSPVDVDKLSNISSWAGYSLLSKTHVATMGPKKASIANPKSKKISKSAES